MDKDKPSSGDAKSQITAVVETTQGIEVFSKDFTHSAKPDGPLHLNHKDKNVHSYSLGAERTAPRDFDPQAHYANPNVEVGSTIFSMVHHADDKQLIMLEKPYNSRITFRTENGSFIGRESELMMDKLSGILTAANGSGGEKHYYELINKKLTNTIDPILQNVLDSTLTRDEYIKLKNAQTLLIETVISHGSSNTDLTNEEETKITSLFNEIKSATKNNPTRR